MTDSRPGIFDSLDREPKRREILEVRKRIIAVLKWPVLTLGLIAAILGALQTYQQGRFFFTVIYLGIYGSVFTVFVLDRRTSFSVRAWVLVAGLYLYSVAVLMRIGLSGIGLEIMILACILSAVFWGVRTGLVVIGISTVVIASVAACMVSGILPIHSEHMLNSLSPLAWATAGIYFTLMTVGLVFIPQMFLNRLNDSLSLLEEKSRNLEESNLILHKEVKAREEAEDAVRQSEEKYRYLVESANSVILRMDANGYITFFNEFAQRFFGFAENEILGRNVVGTIVPETESSGRDLQAMIEGICKDPDRYATNENENMCRDGRRVWIAWTNKPIYDEAGVIREVLCIGNDITARKLAEEAVREAYNIINRSPAVAFLWKNAEGWPVEFVSDNVDNMLGYKAEDFTSGNVTYAGIIHPEDLEKLKNQGITFSRYEGNKDFFYNRYRVLAKDGSARWLDHMTFVRRDEKGDITHYEGVVSDITERVKAEYEKENIQAKLQRSQKMESLGLLAGGVAHDLNNVLSGIVSYPELLLMDLPEDSKLRKPIETMQDSGHRAAAIVQDLLTVARGVATTKEPVNLNDVIREYLDSPEFTKLTQFHPGVTIKSNLDSALLNIHGSHVHMRKVVMNMVSNAAESIAGTGTVTIATENRYVDRLLKGYDNVTIGEYAVLSVSDDGSGISSDDLERIFEPFYTKKVMGRSGTGLGLAVVWHVTQDHNGFIDVKSGEAGTTFEVYIPITRNKISDKISTVPIKDYMGNGETILVVDDVESQRAITSNMLDKLGYTAKAVSSGEEAVEYVKENTADLIVLDMIMDPGINGRETYERIVNIHPKQKAIIVSGFSQTDEVKAAQALGAGQYIKKPLTLQKIGLAVKEELGKKQTTS